MEFVVHILERFFNKTREEATRIMLHVHRRGVGVCGVLYLRSRRDQSDAGDGLRAAASASSAMYFGKGLNGSKLLASGTKAPLEKRKQACMLFAQP